MMKIDLSGKVAIVTGGASGIGKAISKTLAECGAKVCIADINIKEAEKTASEIGQNSIAVKTDVSSSESVREMVEKVIFNFEKIDILINNAGWDEIKFFLDTDPAFWEKVISINYKGVLNTTFFVLPHMVKRKYGVIVNISSDAGRVGSSGEAVYSGCKAGVIAFSKSIAREHAKDNIRVNVVCPGPTETPLLEFIQQSETGKKIISSMEKYIPLKRLGKPEDIAPIVAFLSSDLSSYITGQVISVSGGLTMV
jgi:2-hydroxycyclohexanecarboxyl-CoA dehydrogenase